MLQEDGLEGSAINETFKGKSWQEIQPKHVSYLSDGLIYFKPKAFHYFLPAFLIGCILDDYADHGSTSGTILSCFVPPEKVDSEFEARMRIFTKDQFLVMRRFFHYLIAIGDKDRDLILEAMVFC